MLILHSYARVLPAGVIIEDTLRQVIPKGFNARVDIFSEWLDVGWFSSGPSYAAQEAELLGNKYRGRNIRVIVASGPYALQFVRDYRDRILPGVPVVHLAVGDKDLLERIVKPDYVGKGLDMDPTPTLQFASRLHPDATRLLIVLAGNNTREDQNWDRLARAALPQLRPDLKVEFLVGLPIPEVRRQLASLSRGTIVFTPGYSPDPEGVSPRHSVERMAEASAVAVYSQFATYVGNGIVGGYVTPYEDQAGEAGAAVVQLLKGAAPSEIASGSVRQLPMVDWRQIRRWNIDEKLLPPDTVIKFREPTAWEKYRLELSILGAVLLLQAGLIAALLVQRRSRQRTTIALAESQQQMNLAISAARLSPWIWDATEHKNGTPSRKPQRTERLKGKSVPFEAVIDSVHPADRENLRRAVWRSLRTGNELDVEYRTVEADGSERWISARGRAEGATSPRLLGVALDVTERKAAELRAAQDRSALRHVTRVSVVGQLSAAIAHQLNQPLAAILGNAETAQKMLSREKPDLAELSEICNDIVSEDHRATSVIRRLGDLYKRGDMKTEPIDLNELVRETLTLLRTELLIRHITPVTEFATGLPTIEGGRVQLQQVVLNLVLNAADAMSEVKADERRLTLRTESRDADIRLFVVDNGTGIPAEHLRTVFDPFWTTKTGGMGMGLAICQSIVASHSGRITVANNAEGGATFCVTLPTKSPSSP